MGSSRSFDRVADRYDASRGGEKRGHEFAADVTPHLAPGLILEVGIGTGVVAGGLRDLGRRVGGIDISPLMAKRAYDRLGPVVALGDSQAVPVRDGAVANVLFCMVLHLVEDVAATLAEAARILAPGGRLVAIHAAPTSEPADADGADMLAAVAPLAALRQQRPDQSLDEAAAGAGLVSIHSGHTEAVRLTDTPRSVADGMRERLWSYLWKVNDDDWRTQVEPVLAALDALPDPDRPRVFVNRHRMSVFRV